MIWVGEKVSRFKLRRTGSGEVGAFEALEALSLGIPGRAAPGRALSVIASTDVRLRGANFDALAARALAQHTQLEERRLQIAGTALRAAPE